MVAGGGGVKVKCKGAEYRVGAGIVVEGRHRITQSCNPASLAHPHPPWLNYHVQPSGDEIAETLTRTPTHPHRES